MTTRSYLLQEKQHLEFKRYQCWIHDLFWEMEKYEVMLSEINEKIKNYEKAKQKSREQIYPDKHTNR